MAPIGLMGTGQFFTPRPPRPTNDARGASLPPRLVLEFIATRHGSGGRRRSADAELWRPCWPDVAKGRTGAVGSGSTELAEVLALPAWERVQVVETCSPIPTYRRLTQRSSPG